MRLATLLTQDGPKPVGLSLDDQFVDLCEIDHDLPSTWKKILSLDQGLMAAATALAEGMLKGPFVTGKLLAPILEPSKVLCIGLNYRDHALDINSPIPTEPVVFNKFPQSVIGPEATVELPSIAREVDYEAELVVVIGTKGKNISKSTAMRHVAGYTVGNDVSVR
ncbi:MAG: fumarylacetoacetate hydrolase, partial [Planctomycetes bacterium]|nr:fumarylacetoacetate hydrolase [Planctomycetota bacterium]